MNASAGIWSIIIMATFFVIPLGLGIALILLSRRRGKGYAACGQCGYDVKASIESGSRCPECGSAFAEVGITPPGSGSGRNPYLFIPGLVLITIAVGCVGTSLLTFLFRA